MLNIKLFQPSSLGLGLIVALIATTIAPASAQQVIIIERRGFDAVNQQPSVGSFIYGSPISTPMPVDPATGLMPNRTNNLYPQVRQNIRETVLVNPVLVNPKIRNSTLINPVIVRDLRYSTPIHQPTIITHPW